MQRKLRMAMIGGGRGSFIGAVHRIAAAMDGQIELVAGAFSSDPACSKLTGQDLFLDPGRVYDDYETLLEKEAALPVEKKADIISIVTPNHLHLAPALRALEKGFDVVLEKPMTFSLQEARLLDQKRKETGRELLLCHTYTGYPMVKEARARIAAGQLGTIRKIYGEYPQGWLHTYLEGSQHKQADWRTDPARSGVAGAMGDIGTHIFNLIEYVSGLQVTKLCADVHTVVANRKLDDDGAALLRFNNGASGVLMATQVAAGEENKVCFRIYGEKGGLEWHQQDANTLLLKWPDRPTEVVRTGTAYVSEAARHNTRVPAGHPEGYLEAFANLYRNFSLALRAKASGKVPPKEVLDYPGTTEGVRGMGFIETMIASSHSSQKWMDLLV
ncbi:MAG: gfo/Idh/MocA family oxidoreductase [Chitinophagia bacterium]|nr:gfo/Idh/MocA family oxidoreductase [Chitinophagia bacterium]